MIPDAECVKTMSEILSGLKLGNYVIKVGFQTTSNISISCNFT